MCKLNKKSGLKRIDPCMKIIIGNLNSSGIKTFASCCGHNKYPMTIIVKEVGTGYYRDLFTNSIITRKKRFYKKDKEDYYFIPEVFKEI